MDPTAAPEPPAPAAQPDAPPSRITIAAYLEKITPHAWVTPTIAGLIVVGFLVEIGLGASPMAPTALQLLKAGGNFGPSVDSGEWWRMGTSLFLHAGLIHIGFNLWAFWNIGKFTERVFGNLPFLVIYALSGFGGAIASLAVHPLTVCVGASGAIFGVYGALLSFVLLHRGVFPDTFLQKQRNSLLGFLAYNVVFSLSVPNIDLSAHGGGLVTGMMAGALLGRDLARPATQVGRRVAAAAAMALGLLALTVPVHRRLHAVPEIAADRLADEAYKHLHARELPQAIDLYSQAIALDRNAGWISNRGLAHLWSGELPAALTDFQEANTLEPTARTSGLLCDASARSAKSAAELDKANRWCTEALALDPKNADMLAWRASVHDDQKLSELALADADAALKIDPTNDLALRVRLRTHYVEENYDASEADCALLLKQAEPGKTILTACAAIARQRGDTAAARARLDRALAVAPQDTSVLFERALMSEKQGDLATSRADYLALVDLEPKSEAGWNNLAWVEIQLGDYAAAREHADRAVSLDADSAANRGTRCFALVGVGDFKAARADCARAVELNAASEVDRGMLAFLDHRYDDARKSWAAASESPADARALAPWVAKLPHR